MSLDHQPTKNQIIAAAERIRPFLHHTPVLTSKALDLLAGCNIFFKCENFQKVGAFKARGATNAVLSLGYESCKNGVATHSSGNHAAALSMAARLKNIPAYIVMPSDSSLVKIEAVKSYGGKITFCAPNLQAREDTLLQVLNDTNAIEIHPYNNYRIIEGQATAAMELIDEYPNLHSIIAPVGGGGLLSGTALSAKYFANQIQVYGAEPAGADDAFQSFYAKTLIPVKNPNTIADGLRTSLGSLTYPIIAQNVTGILKVDDSETIKAMKLVWERMKILIEPSSAVALAVLLKHKELFEEQNVGLIFSGGNVDLSNLPW